MEANQRSGSIRINTLINHVLDSITGHTKSLGLEQRIYNLVCFVASAVAITSFIAELFFEIHWLVKWVTVASVLMFVFFYYLSRFKNMFFKWPVIVLILLILSVSWFATQGSGGPVIFLYILSTVGFVCISDDRHYWVVSFLLFANVVFLYILELSFPFLLIPYFSESARIADVIFTVTCSACFIVFLMVVIKKEYGKERVKVENYRRMEKTLRQSEKRFREIIEGVSEIAIQGYDEQRRVTFWNRASAILYGYSENEALGKKLEELIIPETMVEKVKDLHYRWVEFGEKIVPGELVLKDKLKNDVLVFSSHVMSITPQGKEMFCIDVDLTPLKKAQKEKQQLQSQLRQSQKMEAIGTLAGGIAHDFNNILQGIAGYAELMLLDKEKEDPDYSNIKAIHGASGRGKNLVSQLLFFSRKAKTTRKPLSIERQVKMAKKLLGQTIPRMIEINMDFSPDLWIIMADPIQIEQVVLNLGSNAAQAMPDGGTLTILASNITIDKPFFYDGRDVALGDYVKLSIADTGHGMSKEIVEKIFDPFYTTKETGMGTGLGLTSVYGIVKEHEGTIFCRSELNKGTVFTIYFPALKEKLKIREHSKVTRLSGGTETILTVDDEKIIRDLAIKSLVPLGYKVLTAVNGEKALEIFKESKDKIDLVLLDINMPGMGGQKCLEELLLVDPEVKVLLSSGYATQAKIEENLNHGACGYLEKPYQFSDLTHSIRKILDA